jgi:branched-chain amino acid transport system substrate-binding protein
MKRLRLFFVISVICALLCVEGQGLAAGTKYTVPVISDFTGAYAELFKSWLPIYKGVLAWWNDNYGKGLGVELEYKAYDGRNDPPTIASMWPGILAECKPIVTLGGGGADVAALQQRLQQDKVPVFYGTAAYGYGWLPNQWIFQARPTYTHEMVAALRWYIQKHPEKRPVKFGFLSAQIPPALDNVKGMVKYIQEKLEPEGACKYVGAEYVDINPVDVSNQVKKLIDAKADMISGPATTGMAAAYIRACELHGVNIPTLMAPHQTIYPFARAMKTYKPFEGHFVVAAHASVTDKSSDAYRFFKLLMEKYGLKEDQWNPYSMMALPQAVLAVRAVEHAAKKVGAANLTGQAVYDAMFTQPFTYDELMGLLPAQFFTKEAPFSLKDLKVMIETVKDGQYVLATPEWVPVPNDVTKW